MVNVFHHVSSVTAFWIASTTLTNSTVVSPLLTHTAVIFCHTSLFSETKIASACEHESAGFTANTIAQAVLLTSWALTLLGSLWLSHDPLDTASSHPTASAAFSNKFAPNSETFRALLQYQVHVIILKFAIKFWWFNSLVFTITINVTLIIFC